MSDYTMPVFNSRLGTCSKRATALLVAGACLVSGSATFAQTVAGVVKKNEGNVVIVRAGQTIPVSVGTKVMAGDMLRTAGASSTGLMMKDETRISMGPNSQMSLDKYMFNANSHQGGMFINVVKGTLMMISGFLVKANPASATLKTPTATVGIRGTEFIVEVP